MYYKLYWYQILTFESHIMKKLPFFHVKSMEIVAVVGTLVNINLFRSNLEIIFFGIRNTLGSENNKIRNFRFFTV